ncbi:MAG: glycosyl hydrolase 53 family protein [Clostridia bacterium]|nr:glycosyl hydrolase 53 family protein [Clostridia bacterium]
MFVGMNIHRHGNPFFSYPFADIESNLDYCVDLGCKMIRYNQSCGSESDIETVKKVSAICHKKKMQFFHCIDKYDDWVKEEHEDIERYFEDCMFNIADKLKGCVDIYQLFNEMDVIAMRGDIKNIILPGKDGKEKGEYDSVRFENAVLAVRGAIKGVRRADKDAKICINFAWWHTALIYEMYRRGCDFDIIGLDWYSDCEEVSSIEKLIADVKKNIPGKDFIICETNFWMHPMSRDPIEKQNALKVKELRDENQKKWVPEFIEKVADLKDSSILGIVFYELLDEPVFEKDEYCGEAHFGFIACDRNGKNKVKKPAYDSLKNCIKKLNL